MNDKKLFCFTPLVTLLTFITEFVLAIITIAKHGKTAYGKLAAIFLVLLSSFQIAQYVMCSTGDPHGIWVRVGWVGITLLPAVGYHFVRALNRKQPDIVSWIGYGIAGVLATALMTSPDPLLIHSCTGHFVAFSTDSSVFHLTHYWYYVAYIVFAVIQAGIFIKKNQYKEANLWVIMGYVAFVIPALVLAALSQDASTGVPSIMCGFAIIAAVIMIAKILPKAK